MAFGTPPDGSDAIIHVGTTLIGATNPVGGLFNWGWVEDSPTTERRYYMQPSITAVGRISRTINLQCDYEEGDSGQIILFLAKAAQTNVFIRVLPGGADGEAMEARVSRQEINGPDPDGFSTVSWTLTQVDDPTTVADGFGSAEAT